jgi:hypothetical protein
VAHALNLAAARLRHIRRYRVVDRRYLNIELLKDHQMRGAITASASAGRRSANQMCEKCWTLPFVFTIV